MCEFTERYLMDDNGFFKFFVIILFVAIGIFWFFHSSFEFECPLPNGGYYKVQWVKEKTKFNVFHWQPKKNAKPLPKNSFVITGEPEVEEEKPHF